MVEVRADCYVLADEGGEMRFCGPGSLCIWSMQFARTPHRSKEQGNIALEKTSPDGFRRRFANVIELAQWAAAKALGSGAKNKWLQNGEDLTKGK